MTRTALEITSKTDAMTQAAVNGARGWHPASAPDRDRLGRDPWHVGRFGVWGTKGALTPEFAAAVEQLGYGAVWIGGAAGDLRLAEQLLDATRTLTVATGIVNVWTYPPGPVAQAWQRVEAAHPGRLLLGVGIGHPEVVGADYSHPYAALTRYLNALDAAGVPAQSRVLAALRPRMFRLSGQRSAGAHPYLVTPEHTRRARDILGPGPLLAPEQKVVLDPDTTRARALARHTVPRYLALRNYVANLRWLGYTDTDLTAPGSDRLADDLVPHGSLHEVAAALHAHLDAGADHVPIQLLTPDDTDPLPALEALAGVLFDNTAPESGGARVWSDRVRSGAEHCRSPARMNC